MKPKIRGVGILLLAASALPLAAQTNVFTTSVFITGRAVPTSGAGLEAFYSSGSFLLSYDRTNSVYKPLAFDGSDQEFNINGSEKMRIASNGYIGIGTTSPGYKLDVRDATDAQIAALETGSGNNNRVVIGANASEAYVQELYSSNAKPLTFKINTEKMRIDPNGNVGIGTSSPNAKLQIDLAAAGYGAIFNIVPNTNAVLAFQVGGVDKGYLLWNYNDAGSGPGSSIHLQNQQGKLHLFDNTGTGISVSAGNVGIGTTNPTQKLSVNGTIQAKEVIVQTGWSDYVFADDYRLAPLSEVESHIKSEGHLPGIPSAAEVAEHGVSMGEMQSKLLAKIEELTLHLIEQEKRLGEQSARQFEQEKELRVLRQENKEILSRFNP